MNISTEAFSQMRAIGAQQCTQLAILIRLLSYPIFKVHSRKFESTEEEKKKVSEKKYICSHNATADTQKKMLPSETIIVFFAPSGIATHDGAIKDVKQ